MENESCSSKRIFLVKKQMVIKYKIAIEKSRLQVVHQHHEGDIFQESVMKECTSNYFSLCLE